MDILIGTKNDYKATEMAYFLGRFAKISLARSRPIGCKLLLRLVLYNKWGIENLPYAVK
jgi:hypothetical protein